MLYFPPCKINLGLLVTAKRSDNYHDIETVFYPVPLCDALEFVEADEFGFQISGIELDSDVEDNLVVKAYRLLQADYHLPNIKIHLHKNIPSGAGLGGGSADASCMLTALNSYFQLNLSVSELQNYALQLGSDCPFFIHPEASFATGRGEILHRIAVNLSGYYLVVVKPPIHVSTSKAYSFMSPTAPKESLVDLLQLPIEDWRGRVINQFEDYVFHVAPEVAEVKTKLYDLGASFALMSGSGSAVYGLFKEAPQLAGIFSDNYAVFTQKLD